MATVQETRTKPSRPERDPQVYHPLDRLRGIIRRYVVIEGLLTAVLFLAAWFTIGLILDFGVFKVSGWDWAQDGSWWVRLIALVVTLALFAGILIFRIVRRLTTEFSYPALALVLERRFPKLLGDRLITAVEMADVEAMGKFGYSQDMLRATIAEARERVGKVPVQEVFNWRRLWVLGFLTVGLLVATLLFSYASYAIAAKSGNPYRFGWKFAHVSGIFAERNVALMNTPWPRRAHLELVGFPESGELTVGRDAPPPRVTARAYRWVIADRGAPAGWRPLVWSDLNESFVGRAIPELPPRITAATSQEGGVTVDAVERLAYESGEDVSPELAKIRAEVKEQMNTGGGQSYEELQEVFGALIKKADQPSMGRTLRRLDVPGEVSYKFSGRRTAGSGTLTPQQNNEFAGEIGGLKEDVEFVVRAENFVSAARKIRLIPPPSLKRLYREQSEPAYLHHAPPTGEGYDALEERLQKVATKDLSLTGDRTVFVVPAGTELTLRADAYTADDGSLSDNDRIVSAVAIPVVGRFPGTVFENGKPTQTPVPLKLTGDGTGFSATFDNTLKIPGKVSRGGDFLSSVVAGVRRSTNFEVHENVEFRVEFTNKYNVKTTRSFLIQALPDQSPTVEVAVDVIRKVGPTYMVTANARIPFNTDSFIKDDRGLSKVEYVFRYQAEDSDVVRGIRTQLALRSLLQSSPLPGTPQSVALPIAHWDNFRFLDKADVSLRANLFVGEFENQMRLLRRDTREQFEAHLKTPKSEDVAPQTVKKIELRDPSQHFIDLDVRFPPGHPKAGDRVFDILPKGGDVQALYRMEIDVQATDNNVDHEGGPRVTKNAEPIRLKVVSEGDLLFEIAREEEQLAARYDEALAKLAAAKKKYEFVRSNNGYASETPDQVDAVKVRAQDALGDVDKARDIVQSVGREFNRILRECQINRLNAAAIKRYTEYAKDPEDILSENGPNGMLTFPQALAFLNNVQNSLNGGRWAPLAAVSDAEIALYKLESELRTIRAKLGEGQSLNKLKAAVNAIRERQSRIRKEVEDWKERILGRFLLLHPTIDEVGAVSLGKGEVKRVQHTLTWNKYEADDIVVKVEVYDANNNIVKDALTVPAELNLNFEKNQFRFEYDIKAGNKDGAWKVRLMPAKGPHIDVQVTVK